MIIIKNYIAVTEKMDYYKSFFLRTVDFILDKIKGRSFAGFSQKVKTARLVCAFCDLWSLYWPSISSNTRLMCVKERERVCVCACVCVCVCV